MVDLVFERPPLFLGALYRSDIGPDAGAAPVGEGVSFHQHPAPVAQTTRDFAFTRQLAQQGVLVGDAAIDGIGVEACADAPLGDFAECHAIAQDAFSIRPVMQRGKGAIEGDELLLFIEHDEGMRQLGDGFMKSAQLQFRLLPLDFGGDIPGHTAIAGEFPGCVEQGCPAGLDPDGAAIVESPSEDKAADGLVRPQRREIFLPTLLIAVDRADFGAEPADELIGVVPSVVTMLGEK